MADRKKGSGIDGQARVASAHASADTLERSLVRQLRQAIEDSGLTGYALWRRTGVSQSTISKFLSGEQENLTIETVAKLCAELGLIIRIEPNAKNREKS